MKRPRRPVKKARKVALNKSAIARKRRQTIADIREHLMPLGLGSEEAAIFDIPKPPPGFAYQWSAITAVFGMELKGWSRVPFSRHPEIGKERNFDGYIVYRDMTLFQIAAELVEAYRSSQRKKAQSMAQNSGNEALAALGNYAGLRTRGLSREFTILSDHFLATEEYQRPDTGPAVIDLAIKFTMPWRWRDAAAALKMDESEYVRRRLLMQDTLLAADFSGTYSTVKLTTEKSED